MRHALQRLASPLQASRYRRFGWALVLFSVLAIPLLWSYGGAAATRWMFVFDPSDVTTWAELVDYVANLRVPIPLVISLAEIAEFRLTGQLLITTRVAYPVAVYLSFALALWLASASAARLVAAWVLAVVFVWGMRIVHYANPQTYDVIFPALVLAYVVCLDLARRPTNEARSSGLLALTAGLSLSLAELTRPFFIFLMPFLLVAACLVLRPLGWRRVALFLMPVVLLSGSWHVFIAQAHGQLVWTNHSGFNLHRNWYMVELPILVEEVNGAPLAPGRWPHLNTPEHSENSRRIQAAIVTWILEHPAEAVDHALNRLGNFLSVPTGYYGWQPDHPGLRYYRWAVWAALAWIAVQPLVAISALLRRRWLAFIAAESQLIGIVLLTLLILALGESAEEARFIVSLLPMLAALPLFGLSSWSVVTGAPRISPPAAMPPGPQSTA